MKKLIYGTLVLGLLATTSCEGDEVKTPAPEPLPTNAVTYNQKNYPIDNGTIIDWGSFEDYYNYDFFLTDGELDLENETAEGASVMVYAELWSPGTENFSNGTYTFIENGGSQGKPFFDNVFVVTDTNNNGELDENDDQITVKAGTFKVSGSGTKYSIEVDATLTNDKTLKGTYSGTFEKFNGTIVEESGRTHRAGKSGKNIFK